MNTVIEARIARVARVRGCGFCEAAAIVAKRGALRRAALAQGRAARERRMLTTWYWRRDFE
jgi:hypothetical protein